MQSTLQCACAGDTCHADSADKLGDAGTAAHPASSPDASAASTFATPYSVPATLTS
jgi:hypothetical protein